MLSALVLKANAGGLLETAQGAGQRLVAVYARRPLVEEFSSLRVWSFA
jgi:hypothetical protein